MSKINNDSQYWKIMQESSEEAWNLKKELVSKQSFIGLRILDIGSSGAIFNKDFIQNNEYHCLDFDQHALKVADEKGAQTTNHDLNSFDPLPYTDDFFNVTISFDTLEHIARPSQVMKEITRITKPGGTILLSFPNGLNFINRFFRLLGKSYDITDMSHFTGELFSDHLHTITLGSARQLIKNNQLTIIEEHFYLQQQARHKKLTKLNFVLALMHFFRLQRIFPTLFSFSFIFICRRNSV